MMDNYCGYCGATIRGGTRFCRQCGTEIESGAPHPQALPDASEPSRRPAPSYSGVGESSAVRVSISDAPPDQAASAPEPTEAEAIERAEHNRRHLRLVRASDPIGEEPDSPAGGVRSDIAAPPVERQARTADALAAASGLAAASPAGARVRYLLIVSAVCLVGVAALGYYRQSLPLLQSDARERNLITPEEQSQQWIRLGEQDELSGDYESATAHYREALSITPRSITAHLQMARSLKALGRIDEALKSYAAVLRESPRHIDARWLMADLYHLRGNWRDAYQEYQRIIAIDPQSAQAMAALVMIEDYQARQAGRPPVRRAVVRSFDRKPPAGPQLPSVDGAYAPLAVPLPAAPGAAVAAPPTFWTQSPETAADQRHSLMASYMERGRRYLNIREYSAAIAAFQAVVRLGPEEKDIYYLIATCYSALGQKALAYENYLKCTSGQFAQVSASAAKMTQGVMAKEMAKNRSARPASPPAEIGLPSRPTIHSVNKTP